MKEHLKDKPSDEDDPLAGERRRYLLLAASFEGLRNDAFVSGVSGGDEDCILRKT